MACAKLVWAVLLLGGCTSNPYYIGAVGASATGGDPSLTFAIDLDQTGTSKLGPALELATGSTPATLIFQGEKAVGNAWPSTSGALQVSSPELPILQLPAPFNDETRVVRLVSSAASYRAVRTDLGAVGGDDFALELVLRTAPGTTILQKQLAGKGWGVTVAADGTLQLGLADSAGNVASIASDPLVPGAWYHCLFWVSHSAGGRVYCDGRESPLSQLSALGTLDVASALAVGGGAPANGESTQIAYFALFRSSAGLGKASDWARVSRQRFAALTGISPRVARGTPLPAPGLRDSPAYLDLQRDSGAPRQLFLVGPDWPRVACRSDQNGKHDCGYLSEAKRTRWSDPQASAWTASGLSVAADNADFADGKQRMEGLVASTAKVAHSLTWSGSYGGARQALSFYARAETGNLVAATVSGQGTAVFDVRAGTVAAAPSVGSAAIEDWGDGLFRCSYVFAPDATAMTATSYTLELLNDAANRPFSGDGKSAWVDVAELQLDVGQAYPGSPLAAASQAPDTLTFLADDGNLPRSSAVTQRLRVLLPAGPRLTDQAVVNLNLDGSFDNQVQLYITGDTSQLKFWALRDGNAHWAFNHPVSLVDGLDHSVEADWASDFASLSVDGVSLRQDALRANDPPFALNRIDLGFSSNSSGSLEGLLAGLEIGVTQ